MTVSESPHWGIEAQSYIPHWGTTHPISLPDIKPPIFDSNGRPLNEISTHNPANVPFDMKRVPFSDSRKDFEANYSAYETLTPTLRLSFGILSLLRDRLQPYISTKPTREDLSEIVQAGRMLPYWYILKSDNPMKNGELPPAIAGLTKICTGLMVPFANIETQQVLDRYRNEQTPVDTSFLASPEEFYRFVDQNKMLATPSRKIACPAPPGLIIKGAEILLKKPSVGMEEAREVLRLSTEEIKRIHNLGKAIRVGEAELDGYGGIKVPVTQVEHSLYNSAGITSPTHLRTDLGRRLRRQVAISFKNINRAQYLANQALGRRPAPTLQESDFRYGLSFTIVERKSMIDLLKPPNS